MQVLTLAGRQERVRRGGFPTEVAAERAGQAFLALAEPAVAGRAWTVRRWLEQWLAEQSDQVRSSTLRGDREHVRHYRSPLLDRFWLASLRTMQVQASGHADCGLGPDPLGPTTGVVLGRSVSFRPRVSSAHLGR